MSRVSVMTGLRRREVARLMSEEYEGASSGSMLTKVIGQWLHDTRFVTKAKAPRVLTIQGEESEFSKLVESVSSDVKPGTLLKHLEALGAVEFTTKGVRLIESAYIPKNNPTEAFHLLSLDMEDLHLAVEENIYSHSKIPNLHASTEYDNISPADLPEIRKWLLKEGVSFQRRVRQFLSAFDGDVNVRKENGEQRFRVVCGSFSRIAELQSTQEELELV